MHNKYTSTIDLIKRLWHEYIRHYKWHYITAIFFLMSLAASQTVVVSQVPAAIDDALNNKDFAVAMQISAVILLAFFVRGISTFAQATILQNAALRIIETMQNQMFNILTLVDMTFFYHEGTASQLSRFTNDVHYLRTATSKAVTSFGKDLMTMLAMIGTMFWHNAEMAAIIIFVFPLILWPIMTLARKLRRLSSNIQSKLSEMNSALDDSLKGAMQVRAYNMQQQERIRAGNFFRKFYKLNIKSVLYKSAVFPVLDIFAGLAFAAILLWGAYEVMHDTMTTGEFLAFFIAMFAAYSPMRSLSNLYTNVQDGLAAAERIFSLLDHTPAIQSHNKANILKNIRGDVTFENVAFSYKGEESSLVLHDINLKVKATEKVAIVGHSGSGKTSLINLIPRFFEATKGKILIDGHNIKDIDITNLRENIAVVFQNSLLFNTTISENITLGQKNRGIEMSQVLEKAHVSDFIETLPNGLDTEVGELGGLLSGGQRQRIAIARAMYKGAPILLLDEATSQLDNQSEKIVQLALKDLMADKTTFVIAHRLHTVQHADLICVLSKGRLIATGRHDDLLKTCETYQKLCYSDLADS